MSRVPSRDTALGPDDVQDRALAHQDNTSQVNWFRNRAKQLHRDSQTGLMRAQHEVAVAAGFRKWATLVAASPEDLQRAISVAEGK